MKRSTCSSSSSWAVGGVQFAGCTPNPRGRWVTQRPGKLTWRHWRSARSRSAPDSDRDKKFSEVLKGLPERWARDRSHAVSRDPRQTVSRKVRTDGARSVWIWSCIPTARHLEQVVRGSSSITTASTTSWLGLGSSRAGCLPTGEWCGACVLRRNRMGGAIRVPPSRPERVLHPTATRTRCPRRFLAHPTHLIARKLDGVPSGR